MRTLLGDVLSAVVEAVLVMKAKMKHLKHVQSVLLRLQKNVLTKKSNVTISEIKAT